jgi:hypothetical protein
MKTRALEFVSVAYLSLLKVYAANTVDAVVHGCAFWPLGP